ncbi:hypothetical protein HDU96_009712 [Phlyctochytrium bullatum]|nr:hypothetical protein HDU96_009712 [Phlyctochytrium bullatum]
MQPRRRLQGAAAVAAAIVAVLTFATTATAQTSTPLTCFEYTTPRCVRIGQIRNLQLGRTDLLGAFFSCGDRRDTPDPVPTYNALCSVCPEGVDIRSTINDACELVGFEGASGIIHYRTRKTSDELLPTIVYEDGCPKNAFCEAGPVTENRPFNGAGGFPNSTITLHHCYCSLTIPNGRGGVTKVPYGDSASFTVPGFRRGLLFDLETESIIAPGEAHTPTS